MGAKAVSRHALPAGVLLFALTGCGVKHELPPPPEIATPAPAPSMTPVEDRGRQPAGETVAPSSEQDALRNVGSGEAERAASRRGHESAGDAPPAATPAPGNGG